MKKMLKTVLGLAGAAALAVNAGCGSSDCGSGLASGPAACPTPPPPTPAPPVMETVVIYGDNGSVPAEAGGYIEFGVPSAGRLDATVDWTFSTSMVAIALTTSACDDLEAAFLGQCSHIAPANISRTQKPKTVSGSVSQAGVARLWLLNLATVDESMAVQVTLTRTRGLALPSGGPAPRFVPMPASEVAKARRGFEP